MELHRIVVIGTVVLIVAVSIASGPLVGLSLTTDAEEYEPGDGTINATVASVPESATLEEAKYSVEGYHLRAEPVELRIHDITGQPTIAYDLVIHELGYTRSSVAFLDSSFTETYQLEFEPTKLDADRITQDEYNGTIRIVHTDEERTLTETDIQIEVVE